MDAKRLLSSRMLRVPGFIGEQSGSFVRPSALVLLVLALESDSGV